MYIYVERQRDTHTHRPKAYPNRRRPPLVGELVSERQWSLTVVDHYVRIVVIVDYMSLLVCYVMCVIHVCLASSCQNGQLARQVCMYLI